MTGDPPIPTEPMPGDYWRGRSDENQPWEWWIIGPRKGLPATRITKHEVVEHDDGTITASPSILVNYGSGPSWHGYLEAGRWREV